MADISANKRVAAPTYQLVRDRTHLPLARLVLVGFLTPHDKVSPIQAVAQLSLRCPHLKPMASLVRQPVPNKNSTKSA
jgi:hypothetical protein